MSSSSLDYDMSYKVPNATESDPKKRKGPLEKAFQNEAREQCDGEVSRMFYTGGLSFNLARNPHYRNSYVRASQIPGYVPPGYNALRTTLLQKERKNIEMHLQPLKNTWKQKGVVTDNASNCVKAGALISAKFPTIFWTPCVVHTLNLALKNICSPLLSTRNNEAVLVMFTEHCDLKLLTIASTRFASTVVMLKRFKKIKTGLQQMVISPKWDDYKEDGVERASAVKKKILDKLFREELEYALSFTLPIYSVIRAIDTDKPSLHLVYEWYYSSEWLAEEDSRKAPHQDLEVTRERKNCIMKYFPNQDERREVNVEYSNFSLCMEDFGSVDVIHDRFILEPLRWWAVHGSSAPKLQILAFKLLGQPFSSSCCERNWSTYKFIHSAIRNKIVPQRAEDLVFVHTNLRLLSRRSSSYKEGPSCMWDVGGDQFDSLDEINLGKLEFEDLSLDELELEAVLFGGDGENENNDEFDI
uniref:HAT C-terminal dimerisation domain-containing protein n=1 Tax=Brassica oleracea var. oleracea TaxID=109376 RepID=A0A0D3CZA6_BRAOL